MIKLCVLSQEELFVARIQISVDTIKGVLDGKEENSDKPKEK